MTEQEREIIDAFLTAHELFDAHGPVKCVRDIAANQRRFEDAVARNQFVYDIAEGYRRRTSACIDTRNLLEAALMLMEAKTVLPREPSRLNHEDYNCLVKLLYVLGEALAKAFPAGKKRGVRAKGRNRKGVKGLG